MVNIGKRIKALRLEKGWTHRQLSDILKISVVSISGWENGSRQPSAEALILLANFPNSSEALAMITPAPARIIGFLACLIKSNAFLTCLRLPLIVGL